MKKFSIVLALIVAIVVCLPVLAADKLVVCQVTDLGGIDDKSFNQTAWNGVQAGIDTLGVDGRFLESKSDADYETNINQFVSDGCDLVITVGFMLGDATIAAADMFPEQKLTLIPLPEKTMLPIRFSRPMKPLS